MNASLLTSKHPPGGPPADLPAIWRSANRRAGTVYVQGHLLNENLGGPGRAYNLTPITRRANAQHHQQVESTVKRVVLSDGGVVSYRVTPIYGRHPDRGYQLTLRRKARRTRLEQLKLEIMDYEQNHLARAFTTVWVTLRLAGGRWLPAGSPDTRSVLNDLPDGDFDING